MTVVLERVKIPERGVFTISQSIDIRVTAEEARRKVNRWLLEYVSDMMRAEEPTLVVDERAVWRVPAVLTATHIGAVGTVGTVNIDVLTGEMLDIVKCKSEIEAYGITLAETIPPYPGPREVTDEFIPKDVPSAKMLVLSQED